MRVEQKPREDRESAPIKPLNEHGMSMVREHGQKNKSLRDVSMTERGEFTLLLYFSP